MPTILVVDDTQAIRQLASVTLKTAGYDVGEAGSGQEALDYIETNPPDLMLLDVMMPGLTGFDTLSEVRTRWPELDLPVIFLTAKSDITDKEKGYEAGAEDYITKPFIPKELILRVQTQIRMKTDRDKLRNDARVQEELSATDELTTVYNRRHLIQRMKEEMAEAHRYARPVAFIMFDIDHFKRINDTYGHLTGDDILRDLAALIKSSIRQEDVLARYGGEEFGILLPSTWADIAVKMGERIRRVIEEHEFFSAGRTLHITVSVGISGFPVDPVQTNEELIEVADKRLYTAKNGGRNQVVGPSNWDSQGVQKESEAA